MPATGRLFLIAIGTPANGRWSPAPIASAVRERASASTWMNALSVGLSSSMRSQRRLHELARAALPRADHGCQLAWPEAKHEQLQRSSA